MPNHENVTILQIFAGAFKNCEKLKFENVKIDEALIDFLSFMKLLLKTPMTRECPFSISEIEDVLTKSPHKISKKDRAVVVAVLASMEGRKILEKLAYLHYGKDKMPKALLDKIKKDAELKYSPSK